MSAAQWVALVGSLVAAVAVLARGLVWLLARAKAREQERLDTAVATARRHAEEAAYRERIVADLTHVRVRVDEAHATIGEVRADLAETREHVAELRGAAGRKLAAVK